MMNTKPPRCLSCAYNLESSEAVCPECGHAIDYITNRRSAIVVSRLASTGSGPFWLIFLVDVVLFLSFAAKLMISPFSVWRLSLPDDIYLLAIVIAVVASSFTIVKLYQMSRWMLFLATLLHMGLATSLIVILKTFHLESSYGLYVCVVGMFGVFMITGGIYALVASDLCLGPQAKWSPVIRVAVYILLAASGISVGCWYLSIYAAPVALAGCLALMLILSRLLHLWSGFGAAREDDLDEARI